MIVKCNCGNTLTKKLKYHAKWLSEENAKYHGEKIFIGPGTYLTDTEWLVDDFICVNPDDVLNCDLPEFKTGLGCCNHGGTGFYCSSCKELVGYMMLDCTCSQAFLFDYNKVYEEDY